MAVGTTPRVTALGALDSEGILLLTAQAFDMPGAIVFQANNVFENHFYTMLWCNASGKLRILDVTALFDEGSQTLDLSGFDQNTSGELVADQT